MNRSLLIAVVDHLGRYIRPRICNKMNGLISGSVELCILKYETRCSAYGRRYEALNKWIMP